MMTTLPGAGKVIDMVCKKMGHCVAKKIPMRPPYMYVCVFEFPASNSPKADATRKIAIKNIHLSSIS